MSGKNKSITPGQKVAELRNVFGLSQIQIADVCGVSYGVVSNWEKGRFNPSPKNLRILSDTYNVALDWFQDGRAGVPLVPKAQGTAAIVKEARLAYGRTVFIKCFQGVLAGSDDGTCFFSNDDYEDVEIPTYFLGGEDPELFFMIRAEGSSMSPRIEHSERAIVRYNSKPSLRSIVVVKAPDQSMFVKVLAPGNSPVPYSLLSLNPAFPPITDIKGWEFVGHLVAILKEFDTGPNMEWRSGIALRA